MESLNKELQQLDEVFSAMAGETAADDSEVYRCQLCRDSGYLISDGRASLCPCRHEQELVARKTSAGLTPRLQGMTFESFSLLHYSDAMRIEQGRSHRYLAEKALRGARSFVRDCAGSSRPSGILFEGEIGSGKTHLAAAIANHLVEQGIDIQFLVVPEFLDQLRASYRRENEGLDESEIIKRAYDVPVLFLDDMGAHNFTAWVENKLFTIINHRYNYRLPMVITTNLTINDMHENISERASSRLSEACSFFRLVIDRDLRLKQNPTGRKL